ncbi:hypothetical protein F0U60_30355 [Archangium minus]|uniref:Uncharacterized protein n=1 Tax=Archangium minus TaxID=83450 RepID=A0ABY9WXT5_9BACT|nr:hypothetical protein F0U60_30355 [Archangium minus]
MASAKDKCFEDAVNAYQKLREQAGSPLDIKVTHQTPWVRDLSVPNSRWGPVKYSFKEWFHIYGYAKNKFGFGKTQVRYPDVTVEMKDGSHLVLDNKFTNRSGNPDGWRRGVNANSKTTQRQDYMDINRQQGHNIGEPSLDKKKCKCDEREKKQQLQPQTVPAYQNQPYFMPYPNDPSQALRAGKGLIDAGRGLGSRLPPIRIPPLVPAIP